MSVSSPSVSETVTRLVQGLSGVHAVLLYGSTGNGMLESALDLAQGWLCPEIKNGRACGECSVCRSFLARRNVDFIHYKPWGPSNWLKEQAIRRTKPPYDDDGPETPLMEFVRTAPLMARHKVALFEDADRLYGGAGNALLKTLEEPPPHAKIILVTSEFSRLPATIRSRCMAVACSYDSLNETTDMERVFGGAPGLVEQIRSKQTLYERLWQIFEDSKSAPWGAAIGLAEQTRELTEGFSKALGTGARAANAEILRCFAEWLVVNRSDKPELAQKAVDAHRLVVGNVNAAALFDSLWTHVLAP